jgi:thymidine phosphorylase
LGNTAVKLGAGRAKANDKISYEVGFRLLKTIGESIQLSTKYIFEYITIELN